MRQSQHASLDMTATSPISMFNTLAAAVYKRMDPSTAHNRQTGLRFASLEFHLWIAGGVLQMLFQDNSFRVPNGRLCLEQVVLADMTIVSQQVVFGYVWRD